jgi:hypothetical protein
MPAFACAWRAFAQYEQITSLIVSKIYLDGGNGTVIFEEVELSFCDALEEDLVAFRDRARLSSHGGCMPSMVEEFAASTRWTG